MTETTAPAWVHPTDLLETAENVIMLLQDRWPGLRMDASPTSVGNLDVSWLDGPNYVAVLEALGDHASAPVRHGTYELPGITVHLRRAFSEGVFFASMHTADPDALEGPDYMTWARQHLDASTVDPVLASLWESRHDEILNDPAYDALFRPSYRWMTIYRRNADRIERLAAAA